MRMTHSNRVGGGDITHNKPSFETDACGDTRPSTGSFPFVCSEDGPRVALTPVTNHKSHSLSYNLTRSSESISNTNKLCLANSLVYYLSTHFSLKFSKRPISSLNIHITAVGNEKVGREF